MNTIVKKSSKSSLVRSALIISAGGLLAKLMGAVYRIPLTNLMGSYGMGLYQLIFPPYILLLTISYFGVPAALAKLVAEANEMGLVAKTRALFVQSLAILSVLGLFGSLSLYLLADTLAMLQQNPSLSLAYKIVSPAILLVCVTGAFKGYFQGSMKMVPVSVSQMLEQVAKLVIGLVTANALMPNVTHAVYGAVAAITVSECVSLVVLAIVYACEHKRVRVVRVKENYVPQVLSLALPVVISGFILQLTQLIDSVTVVNMIDLPNVTSLYGLWTGPVNSLLNLPIVLASGVAVTALPAIARSHAVGDEKELSEKYNLILKLTVSIALPAAIGVSVLSRPILSLLYGGLPVSELNVSALLVTLAGISIVAMSIMQSIIAVLQALGKPYVAVLMLSVAAVAKLVFNLLLLPVNYLNIYGAAISDTMCFSLSALSGIIYLRAKKLKGDCVSVVLKPVGACVVMLLGLTLLNTFATSFVNTTLGTFTTILLCAVMYLSALILLKTFNQDEIDTSRLLRRKNGQDGICEESQSAVGQESIQL